MTGTTGCCNMRFRRQCFGMAKTVSIALVAGIVVWLVLANNWPTKEPDESPKFPNPPRGVKNKPSPVHVSAEIQEEVKPVEQPKTNSSLMDFTQAQEAVQSKRKAILRETCKRNGMTSQAGPPMFTKRHIYVVDKYRVMYCFVPKVGCSNWKRIMMVLDGETDTVEGLTSDEVHTKAHLRFFNSYTPGQQEHRLKNYRKFFFVREPLKRALSVYRNKFEDLATYRGNLHFHTFGKQIIKKFRNGPSQAELKTGENATWTEFVDYLTHPTERKEVETDIHFSDHWRQMNQICSPCSIDYDVIGNLETVNADAKYVLNMLKAPSNAQYLSSAGSRPTNSSDKGTFDKYFSKLNKKQLTQLWELYKLDYELFGYTKPEIIPT
ncbi:carbohydrate sulfotransferase 11-like isoform X1 [Asterias rubens]|uniref:carbohydrate sulfotransferase 11-like isoform X1 n=2 Tax=Asterias rubens TaxID=7604 RepID=UPI0014552E28|nr:carbohydrate sulfotransferase 11-like isoform X1 [Asterias rubens]